MEKIKNISVPLKYEVQAFDSERFLKVKIFVMHDKLNLNGSNFGMNAIEDAKETIKNIPILAYIKKSDGTNEEDFLGHEMELVISSDGEMNYRYLGRPIGIIPADDCNYHYEIYDDKTFVVVDGYIWKDYANEALDIIERDIEKGQSMEIIVDEANWDDINSYYDITKYKYTGVTILGNDVTPAMTGAKVTCYSKPQNGFSAEYYSMVEELSNTLKNYTFSKEEEIKEGVEVVEDVVEIVEEIVEEVKEEIVESVEPEVVEPVESVDVEVPVVEETPVEETTVDYEKLYTESNDTIFNLNTEIVSLKEKYALLENENIELKSEIERLKEFKLGVEKEKEFSVKESVFAEYSVGLTEEEMQSVRAEMNNLSKDEIVVMLNAVFTHKNLSELKNKKFSSNTVDPIIMDIPKKDLEKSKYAV